MKRFIPNIITSLNLCFGLISITFMLSDKSDLVFYLFFLCLISDYLDGLFARRLNVIKSLFAFIVGALETSLHLQSQH